MKKDISQLHAIRAVAMVGIFLHHLFQGIGPLRQAHADTLIGEAFMDLALGVVVFNVMTSFLAAMPYVGANALPVPSVREYLPKRLARLCPHFYLAVALVVLGNAVVYKVTGLGAWLPSTLYHLFFLDSLRVQSFMSNTAAYWWLGLLVQFSLAFPLLVVLARRFGLARLTVAATLILWPLTEALKIWGRAAPGGIGETLAFLSTFNLPSRLPEFLMGMWMAELWKERPGRVWIVDARLGGVIFGACAVSLVLWFMGLPRPWFANVAWTLALYVVLFALPATESLGRRQGVLWLSGASYAIYLLHQPILSWLDVAVASFSPWLKFAALGLLGWYFSVQASSWLDALAGRAGGWLSGKGR